MSTDFGWQGEIVPRMASLLAAGRSAYAAVPRRGGKTTASAALACTLAGLPGTRSVELLVHSESDVGPAAEAVSEALCRAGLADRPKSPPERDGDPHEGITLSVTLHPRGLAPIRVTLFTRSDGPDFAVADSCTARLAEREYPSCPCAFLDSMTAAVALDARGGAAVYFRDNAGRLVPLPAGTHPLQAGDAVGAALALLSEKYPGVSQAKLKCDLLPTVEILPARCEVPPCANPFLPQEEQ